MLTSRTAACAPGAETNPKVSILKSKRNTTASRKSNTIWSHAPSQITLLWLAISLPLVVWDTGYVLLRPLTMEGGSLHWPLWVPYKLYGTVDHVYGWKSFNAKNGFTGAQGFLNLIETLMYAYYLWLCWKSGRVLVDDDGKKRRHVAGRDGATASLVGFSAAVMTLSKTVLYCKMNINLFGKRSQLTQAQGSANTTVGSTTLAITLSWTSSICGSFQSKYLGSPLPF